MKIIITQIGHPDFRGGGNTVAHELSSVLQERGHHVTTIFVAPPHLHHQKPETTYCIILLKQSIIPIINSLKVARTVQKSFKEEKTDVVISLGYEGFFVPLLKNRPTFVAASHNFIQPISAKIFFKFKWLNPLSWGKLLYAFQRFLDKHTKLRADYVQALCSFGAQQCEEIYGIPREKIFVVPNGVAIPKAIAGKSNTEKNLLFMGGSSYHKGLDILIRALPAVVRTNPEVRALILGEMKREEKNLRLRAQKLGVMLRLDWYGLVSRERMSGFYKKARLVVFPSRLDTFPLGILESQAQGIPVVATRVGGIPEIVEDGRTGLLVEPENSSALAEAINRLLIDPKLADSIGENSRLAVENKFGWEKVAEEFEKQINERIA